MQLKKTDFFDILFYNLNCPCQKKKTFRSGETETEAVGKAVSPTASSVKDMQQNKTGSVVMATGSVPEAGNRADEKFFHIPEKNRYAERFRTAKRTVRRSVRKIRREAPGPLRESAARRASAFRKEELPHRKNRLSGERYPVRADRTWKYPRRHFSPENPR